MEKPSVEKHTEHGHNEKPIVMETLRREMIEQIELITPTLQEIVDDIIEKKPDMVVFLDKSARPLGTPFHRYLHEQMSDEAPEVLFFNDDHLKWSYLHSQLDKYLSETDYNVFSGKKIFFVDETFASGKGLVALSKLCEHYDIDWNYYAITQDKQPIEAVTDSPSDVLFNGEHRKDLESVFKTSRHAIYDNDIPDLFTRSIARLYVREHEPGQTVSTLSKLSNDDKGSTIPSAEKYLTAAEIEATKQQKADGVRLVAEAKELIYQALK